MLVLGQGRSNPEIAAELHVSRRTVSSRWARTEAALFAMRHGLIGTAGEPGT